MTLSPHRPWLCKLSYERLNNHYEATYANSETTASVHMLAVHPLVAYVIVMYGYRAGHFS